MQTIQLSAQTRSVVGRKVSTLRQADMIPGVLYGHGIENVNVVIPFKKFQQAYNQAGESTLVDLQIDEKTPVKVIINDVQKDSLNGKLTHVDFYQVNMKEKITAEVPLEFIGEAGAVKTLGGILLKNITKVEVEALPGDLPHELKIDISALNTFDDKITIGDIQLPAGVTIKADATEAVVMVEPPRSEEELKALEGEVKADASAVEVLTEKKEEGTEGEAGATGAAPVAAAPAGAAKAQDKK